MLLLQLVRGALVPHAPLLLPQVTGPETASAGTTIREALSEIDPGAADVVVILSPHGRETGVYESPRGSLDEFGYNNVGVELNKNPELNASLAEAWGRPLLQHPIDYGIFVPLILWEPKEKPVLPISIVAVTVSESASEDDAVSFCEALRSIDSDRRVLFVASANGSAGLSPRAPLTQIEGARELEDRLLEALEGDPAGIEDAARALGADAGSCGVGPLIAFARLFAGRSSRVLAHEAPVGVGYTVAVTT